MNFHNYKYKRIVATVIIFLALSVILILFTQIHKLDLLWLLIAGIAELANDLRG